MRLYDQITDSDCFVACLRSFLPETMHDLPPHTEDGHTWSMDFVEYLRSRGKGIAWTQTDNPHLIEREGEVAILSGLSPRDTIHAVIGKIYPSQKKVVLIHDPHPSRLGITEVHTVYRVVDLE